MLLLFTYFNVVVVAAHLSMLLLFVIFIVVAVCLFSTTVFLANVAVVVYLQFCCYLFYSIVAAIVFNSNVLLFVNPNMNMKDLLIMVCVAKFKGANW